MPHILGSDIAGEIVEVGEYVEQRQSRGCECCCRRCITAAMRAVYDGARQQCRGYNVLGYGIDGGNAELMAVPEWTAIPIPDWL